MKTTKTKKRNKHNNFFSVKHYLFVFLGIALLILLAWYIASWYKVKKEERLMTSYLVTTNTISLETDEISEIAQMLKELPSEYFIYISRTNDEEIYKLEKKLKKIITEYEIQDTFYYINVTGENNAISKLNDVFNTTEITNIPCILYFKDNVLEKVIVDKKDIFNPMHFSELLERNEFEKAK